MKKYCYVCLKWGSKYSAEYVNKLASMIQRWDNSYVDIYCYTDNPAGIQPNINIIPIQHDLETWWFKLPLLVEPALSLYQTKVLFDLDVVIHNPIHHLHKYASDNLTVCDAAWKDPSVLEYAYEKNTLYNSSIMVWKDAKYVWEHFSQDPERYMCTYKGIDRFLWHEPLAVDVLPQNIVYSYRRGATLTDTSPYIKRDNYTVALFHGYPKQTDIPNDKLVKDYWYAL